MAIQPVPARAPVRRPVRTTRVPVLSSSSDSSMQADADTVGTTSENTSIETAPFQSYDDSSGYLEDSRGQSTPTRPYATRPYPMQDPGMSPVQPPPPPPRRITRQEFETMYLSDSSINTSSAMDSSAMDSSARLSSSSAMDLSTSFSSSEMDSSVGAPAVVLTAHEKSMLDVCERIADRGDIAFTAEEVQFIRDTCGAMDTAWGGRWTEGIDHTGFEGETHSDGKVWIQAFSDPVFRPIHRVILDKSQETEINLVRREKPSLEMIIMFNRGALVTGADLLRRFFKAAPCTDLLARGITDTSSALFAGVKVFLHVLKRFENGTEADARAGIEMAQRLQALFAPRQ